MAENSYFWDGTTIGDHGAYSSEEMSRLLRSIATPSKQYGVFYSSELGSLDFDYSGLTITINSGAALVHGRYYYNSGNVSFTLPSSSGLTFHRVVLRANVVQQTVRLAVVNGSSTPPTINYESGLYDIPICTIRVSGGAIIAVADDRQFINDISFFARLAVNSTITEGEPTAANIDDVYVDTGLEFVGGELLIPVTGYYSFDVEIKSANGLSVRNYLGASNEGLITWQFVYEQVNANTSNTYNSFSKTFQTPINMTLIGELIGEYYYNLSHKINLEKGTKLRSFYIGFGDRYLVTGSAKTITNVTARFNAKYINSFSTLSSFYE